MSVAELLRQVGVTGAIGSVLAAVGGFGASVAVAAYGAVTSIVSAVFSM